MSTPGTLAIVQQGKVIYKIVAGCNGYNVEKLKEFFKKSPPKDLDDIIFYTINFNVGCPGCIVIQGLNDGKLNNYNLDEKLLDYENVDLFNNPLFNPRRKDGTAAYSLTVEI